MNRKFFTALLGVALFMGAPLIAAVMEYTGADGVTPVKVKAATPLPITGIIGSITASLSGDVCITSSTVTLPVSGTVTAVPTGTQTITGTVVASIPEPISATITGTVVATIPETVTVSGSVTSVCTTTTPLEVSNPGVATSALYAADLATDTPTLLSDVVTLATNDIVEIQVSAASWRGPAGTASGTLQADGIKMSANDNPWSFRFNGVDYAFIADPAAVSRLRVFVHKDR